MHITKYREVKLWPCTNNEMENIIFELNREGKYDKNTMKVRSIMLVFLPFIVSNELSL